MTFLILLNQVKSIIVFSSSAYFLYKNGRMVKICKGVFCQKLLNRLQYKTYCVCCNSRLRKRSPSFEYISRVTIKAKALQRRPNYGLHRRFNFTKLCFSETNYKKYSIGFKCDFTIREIPDFSRIPSSLP